MSLLSWNWIRYGECIYDVILYSLVTLSMVSLTWYCDIKTPSSFKKEKEKVPWTKHLCILSYLDDYLTISVCPPVLRMQYVEKKKRNCCIIFQSSFYILKCFISVFIFLNLCEKTSFLALTNLLTFVTSLFFYPSINYRSYFYTNLKV